MKDKLSIGQVAQATDLSDEGVILPPARTEAGYRSFSPTDVRRLRLASIPAFWRCGGSARTRHRAPARQLQLRRPGTGASKQGWFRCPCHGSTYNDAGVRVFGPAPRSMDRMEVTIDADSGRISVNTGEIAKGTEDNAALAVQA